MRATPTARKPAPLHRLAAIKSSAKRDQPRLSAGQLGPLRRASTADVPTLIDHRLRMWEEIATFPRDELKRHARTYRRFLVGNMASDKLVAFVIPTLKGRLVASGAVWFTGDLPRPSYSAESGYILSMYTDPRFRGRGLARRIVRAAVGECRRRKIRRVALHASPFGRRLYRQLGFERTWEMRLTLPRPRASAKRRR
jgi:GNAT superfamily N-acetyltransferase